MIDMKRYSLDYKVFRLETDARKFCDELNASATRYVRKNKPAHYTPSNVGFIAWYWS